MEYTSRGLRRRGESNRWEVALSHINPITGLRTTTYHTVEGNTKIEAERNRNKLIKQLEKEGLGSTGNMTVNHIVKELLLHKTQTGSICKSTLRHYEADARAIDRYIGKMPISKLRIPDVSSWVGKMMEDGLAPRTIAKPFKLLNQSLEYAIACDIITKNPCKYVKIPSLPRKDVNVLTYAERTRMLDLAYGLISNPQLRFAIILALTTGMRRSEICALRWSDLSDDCSINVNRTLALTNSGLVEKEPKTTAGIRNIPLIPAVYNHLKSLEKEKQVDAAPLNVPFGDPYILGTAGVDSKPYQPNRFTREFKMFADMNGFDVCIHDLRHNFATFALSSGVDPRTVAAILGHANVAVMFNFYAEVDEEAKRKAVPVIMNAFDSEFLKVLSPYTANTSNAPFYTNKNIDDLSIEELEEILRKKRLYGAFVI